MADATALRAALDAYVKSSNAEVAALQAELDQYKRNPVDPVPTPTPTPTPSTPTGWVVQHKFDLTRDEGWTHTTGVRGTTDSAYNRKEQTTFGSGGMAVKAQRASDTATVYSSDAKATFSPVGDLFRLEATIGFTGTPLGMGMFPALWLRPSGTGQGELDVWEYMPKHPSAPLRTKTTLIKTGTNPYNLGSAEKPLGLSATQMNERHTWVYEKVKGKVSVLWDGKVLASITQSEFDSKAGSGSWGQQIEAGHQWYARVTFQVGPPASGGWDSAGPIPAGWRSTTMNVYSMTSYRPAA